MITRSRQFWIEIGLLLLQVHQELYEDSRTLDKPLEEVCRNLRMGWSMRRSLWNLERHFGENASVEVIRLWQGFWDPLRCFQLCNWRSPSARWKTGDIWEQEVEWEGAKVANTWEGNVGHHTLSQDLGPLHRFQRCGGVDRQCYLEVLCHSTQVVIKTSEMATHIGLVQCGHSTQAREGECGVQCAKPEAPT